MMRKPFEMPQVCRKHPCPSVEIINCAAVGIYVVGYLQHEPLQSRRDCMCIATNVAHVDATPAGVVQIHRVIVSTDIRPL